MTKLEDLLWDKSLSSEKEEINSNKDKDVATTMVTMNWACMVICCGGQDKGPIHL